MNDGDATIRFELDPDNAPAADWRAFDAMTAEEQHAAAVSDPDNPPWTAELLARARRRADRMRGRFLQRGELSSGVDER